MNSPELQDCFDCHGATKRFTDLCNFSNSSKIWRLISIRPKVCLSHV